MSSFTSGEIAKKSSELWNNHFKQSSADVVDGIMFNVETLSGQAAKPVFMSIDLETPLGFSTFLANSANHRKVFIPSTFNMSKILKSVKAQESVDLVCDSAFYSIALPGPKEAEYRELVSSVQNVVVASDNSNVKSSIFKGRATVINPLTLN